MERTHLAINEHYAEINYDNKCPFPFELDLARIILNAPIQDVNAVPSTRFFPEQYNPGESFPHLTSLNSYRYENQENLTTGNSETEENSEICPITLEKIVFPVKLRCKHTFEGRAILKWSETSIYCPLCRQIFDLTNLFLGYIKEISNNK